MLVPLLAVIATTPVAQAQTCNRYGQSYGGPLVYFAQPHGPRPYKVQAAGFDAWPGISRDQGSFAVSLGAELWNDQSESGYFVYTGTTTHETMPLDKARCPIDYPTWAECCTHSIASPRDTHGKYAAAATPTCFDSATGVYDHFLVYYNLDEDPGDDDLPPYLPWNWAVGGVGANETDLVGTSAHEFGHGLGLDHTTGPHAVMSWSNRGMTHHRNLYD